MGDMLTNKTQRPEHRMWGIAHLCAADGAGRYRKALSRMKERAKKHTEERGS